MFGSKLNNIKTLLTSISPSLQLQVAFAIHALFLRQGKRRDQTPRYARSLCNVPYLKTGLLNAICATVEVHLCPQTLLKYKHRITQRKLRLKLEAF